MATIVRKLKRLLRPKNRHKIPVPIIWVKTPKCAGTSIWQAVKDYDLPVGVIKWGLISKFIRNRSEEEFRNARKFTVVRNPFDRFVSSYHFCVKKGWVDEGVSFGEFAEMSWDDIKNGPYPMGRVIPVNMVYQHTRPLVEHLSYDLGHCDYIDEFVHFENLERELNDFLTRHSIPPVELPRLNTTKHRTYRDYYDEATWLSVEEKFRQDLERFGYSGRFDAAEG